MRLLGGAVGWDSKGQSPAASPPAASGAKRLAAGALAVFIGDPASTAYSRSAVDLAGFTADLESTTYKRAVEAAKPDTADSEIYKRMSYSNPSYRSLRTETVSCSNPSSSPRQRHEPTNG